MPSAEVANMIPRIQHFFASQPVNRAYLFGSFSRGEETEDSDEERTIKGKTSGSRVVFMDKEGHPIMLHKPHPGNIIKHYALRQVLEELQIRGLLK